MKNCDKNKESYLIYLNTKNFYGWAMSQNLPVGGFKRKENLKNSS